MTGSRSTTPGSLNPLPRSPDGYSAPQRNYPSERRTVPHIAPRPHTSGLAVAEADAMARGRLEETARNEMRRSEQFKNNIHWASVTFIWVMLSTIVCLLGVWIWHKAAPVDWRYLQKDEIDTLYNILTTSSVALLILNFFKSKLGQ